MSDDRATNPFRRKAGHEFPERGQIFSRQGAARPEWWRVSEHLCGAQGVYVVLTLIDDRLTKTIVPASDLTGGRMFERIEARDRRGNGREDAASGLGRGLRARLAVRQE